MNILKASAWIAASLLTVVSLHACAPHAVQLAPAGALCRTEAYFSRRGGAADSVIEALNRAQKTIHVAMYGITHPAIFDALVAESRLLY